MDTFACTQCATVVSADFYGTRNGQPFCDDCLFPSLDQRICSAVAAAIVQKLTA